MKHTPSSATHDPTAPNAAIAATPAAAAAPLPSARLRARLAARGITPDHRSCGQRYRHDRFVPWQIEIAAIDAMQRAEDDADASIDAEEAAGAASSPEDERPPA